MILFHHPVEAGKTVAKSAACRREGINKLNLVTRHEPHHSLRITRNVILSPGLSYFCLFSHHWTNSFCRNSLHENGDFQFWRDIGISTNSLGLHFLIHYLDKCRHDWRNLKHIQTDGRGCVCPRRAQHACSDHQGDKSTTNWRQWPKVEGGDGGGGLIFIPTLQHLFRKNKEEEESWWPILLLSLTQYPSLLLGCAVFSAARLSIGSRNRDGKPQHGRHGVSSVLFRVSPRWNAVFVLWGFLTVCGYGLRSPVRSDRVGEGAPRSLTTSHSSGMEKWVSERPEERLNDMSWKVADIYYLDGAEYNHLQFVLMRKVF